MKKEFEENVILQVQKDYPLFNELTNGGTLDNFEVFESGEIWVNGCVQFKTNLKFNQC